MSEVKLDTPDPQEEPPSPLDEADAGPGVMQELWDAVTEGAFDNLHIDTFFVVLFISMVLCTQTLITLSLRSTALPLFKLLSQPTNKVGMVSALSFS